MEGIGKELASYRLTKVNLMFYIEFNTPYESILRL